MIFLCDACKRVYELDRRDLRCVYCGECRCRTLDTATPADEAKAAGEERSRLE